MSSGARQPQPEPQRSGQRQPAPAPATHDLRQELEATVRSRQELGPEYEALLIERFLEQLDRSIEARIEAHLAGRSRPEPTAQPEFTKEMVGGLNAFHQQLQHVAKDSSTASPLATDDDYDLAPAAGLPRKHLAATLGIGIPITAVAGGIGGLAGIMAVWICIALIWLAILGYLPRPNG